MGAGQGAKELIAPSLSLREHPEVCSFSIHGDHSFPADVGLPLSQILIETGIYGIITTNKGRPLNSLARRQRFLTGRCFLREKGTPCSFDGQRQDLYPPSDTCSIIIAIPHGFSPTQTNPNGWESCYFFKKGVGKRVGWLS